MTISSDAADVLSAFLKPCRMECRSARTWHLTAPWGFQFSKAGPGFVILVDGACVLRLAGMADEITLRRNDFALFTRATGVVLCNRPGSHLVAGDHLLDVGGPAKRDAFHFGGGGTATGLVWGCLGITDDYTRQAFSLLPPLLLAHGDGPDAAGLRSLVRVLLDELDGGRPAGKVIADRALHTLLAYALRAKPLTLPGAENLIPSLNVPGIGMALAAIHANPGHEWSLRELANLAGLSRSKFAERFAEVFGRPPFDYLHDVRMQLACQLLLETDHSLKEISARAGYATKASFSRAFSQCYGCAPGAFRRQKRTPRPGGDDSAPSTAEAPAPDSNENSRNK